MSAHCHRWLPPNVMKRKVQPQEQRLSWTELLLACMPAQKLVVQHMSKSSRNQDLTKQWLQCLSQSGKRK
jgi:nicotinic acid mononucleotide adenylyltransferase